MSRAKRELRKIIAARIIKAELINKDKIVTDEDVESLECVTDLDKHDWKLDIMQEGNTYICDKCGAIWKSKIG